MQKYVTRKSAREIIQKELEAVKADGTGHTNYFSGELKFADMFDMLCYRMDFGEA